MTPTSRRAFLRQAAKVGGSAAALSMFPPAISRALAVAANNRTGTIRDVEHIVILMQENRSFDHYFGTLKGVRGFGDRFPIPLPASGAIGKHRVWYQLNDSVPAAPRVIAPFHLNTQQSFNAMRVAGTPHSWPNAQYAWNHGILANWPTHKQNHSMGYYKEADLPFQFALANAFTICDAYHCSFQGGTNPNRVFAWTGANDPLKQGNGPVIGNSYDNAEHDPTGGYAWLTYPERLQAAGIGWQVYQDMADNFTDNPLAGFRRFRDAFARLPGSDPQLRERGMSTRDLDQLKLDVQANRLPQVSFIVATAEGSEHPGPSSPAQGAEYTAAVLDALTSNTEVWSKTVLFLMFDENDGFFDHVPPPAAPSYVQWHSDPKQAVLAGASTVSTVGEYHEIASAETMEAPALMHRPYGLGPRVPMYVISPWSKGGWVNSQVFDHTSVIRFLETRFGVMEPTITPWRRAVCGDLMSAFNFKDPDGTAFAATLPDTKALAARARALGDTRTPDLPPLPELPTQAAGTRPSRALPYELHASARVHPDKVEVELLFSNTGAAAAVFHVYDQNRLTLAPRRYTVEAGKDLNGLWALGDQMGQYDLWVLGPNGFHRHFSGTASRQGPQPEIQVCYDVANGGVSAKLRNTGSVAATFVLKANAYLDAPAWNVTVAPGAVSEQAWPLCDCGNWYDFSVRVNELPGYVRRFAGRVETGKDTVSDPAMGTLALGAD
ncbi:phospholipase C, phosphocholine-specific [Massilia atriviolacea]|uniref:phospholipase C n=1 Tax=Massilia atriviolacea TaxID=2495579 RepID=A0A430HH72_9BURK|nr:phospholipase C, phosphocholine-specific [Massilia atriviolacea]RSZ56878.1 phospholipase C, phosphocholine-specific [Massilia atriviolacea]